MLHAGGDYQHYDAASQRGQPRYDREGHLPAVERAVLQVGYA